MLIIKDLMALTERMLETLAMDILGSTDVSYQVKCLALKVLLRKLRCLDAILSTILIWSADDINDREFWQNSVKDELKQEVKPSFGLGKLQTIVLEETVETKLRQPTFITEISCRNFSLARRNDTNPHVTDRFEMFIGGREQRQWF